MIHFDEIDSRLELIGKNRLWLSEITGRSEGAIRAALAPNSSPKNRTNLLQKALSDAIEREEERQSAEKSTQRFESQQLVLRPSDEEYESWCEAANGKPTNKWAIETLNRAAGRQRQAISSLPPDEQSAAS